jgi:wobble nucleotide-excising tRNase
LREQARTALDNYRTAVFPAYETAINTYLRKFNAGFSLGSVSSVNTRAGSSCTYNVVINNVPVAVTADADGVPAFRNTLSSGDRNALALAFFFASLDRDSQLAEKIVVIDDPMTSLDEYRSLTTIQEMRRLVTARESVDRTFALEGIFVRAMAECRHDHSNGRQDFTRWLRLYVVGVGRSPRFDHGA